MVRYVPILEKTSCESVASPQCSTPTRGLPKPSRPLRRSLWPHHASAHPYPPQTGARGANANRTSPLRSGQLALAPPIVARLRRLQTRFSFATCSRAFDSIATPTTGMREPTLTTCARRREESGDYTSGLRESIRSQGSRRNRPLNTWITSTSMSPRYRPPKANRTVLVAASDPSRRAVGESSRGRPPGCGYGGCCGIPLLHVLSSSWSVPRFPTVRGALLEGLCRGAESEVQLLRGDSPGPGLGF